MALTLSQFIAKYNGKQLVYTGADKGQCTAVSHLWEINNGWPLTYGNAKDIYKNASSSIYTKVPYKSGVIPKPGDLIIWNSGVGGGYGHIGLCVSGNKSTFISFDQNWPTGTNAHKQQHTYSSVLGFLRPKKLPGEEVSDPMVDKITVFKNVFTTVNARGPSDAEINSYKKDPEFAKNRPYTYVQQKYLYPNWVKKSQYTKDMGDLNKKIAGLTGDLEKAVAQAKTQTEVNNTLTNEINGLQGQLADQVKRIKELEQMLSMPPTGVEKPKKFKINPNDPWIVKLLKNIANSLA